MRSSDAYDNRRVLRVQRQPGLGLEHFKRMPSQNSRLNVSNVVRFIGGGFHPVICRFFGDSKESDSKVSADYISFRIAIFIRDDNRTGASGCLSSLDYGDSGCQHERASRAAPAASTEALRQVSAKVRGPAWARCEAMRASWLVGEERAVGEGRSRDR
jgi:hypothetical protein